VTGAKVPRSRARRCTIRVELPGAPDGGVRCDIRPRSMDAWAVVGGTALRLHLGTLHRRVLPDRCSWALRKSGGVERVLVITLFKEHDMPWPTLRG